MVGGRPDYDTLFESDTYANTIDRGGQTVMGCTPIQETTIENNTCVLAPEVTEGPYYHTAGHPIRQSLAELQDGLLLVRLYVIAG